MTRRTQAPPDSSLNDPRLLKEFQWRFIAALSLLAGLLVAGTVGYWLLEGWPAFDALYMTVITMATVGYGETRPLSTAGRLFTIGLIVSSIGFAGYAISVLVSFVAEGEFYRLYREFRMDKRITNLDQHIVLCGAGRTGRHIAEEFYRTHTTFVLIERDPQVLADVLQMGDLPYLQADATQDETLHLAGIERARGLIAALGDDKDNVFLVLTARALNPNLRIIARVNEEENTGKLLKAGADEIVSPNAIGGLRMASVMLRPAVVSFLDEMLRVRDQTLRIEEVHVSRARGLVGKSLAAVDIRKRTGMLVLAIRDQQGHHRFNPGADTVLNQGDILIVIGTTEQIAELHESGNLG